MATWQLQEATDRFSEVIERALSEGPQVIAVRSSPLFGIDLDTSRPLGE